MNFNVFFTMMNNYINYLLIMWGILPKSTKS